MSKKNAAEVPGLPAAAGVTGPVPPPPPAEPSAQEIALKAEYAAAQGLKPPRNSVKEFKAEADALAFVKAGCSVPKYLAAKGKSKSGQAYASVRKLEDKVRKIMGNRLMDPALLEKWWTLKMFRNKNEMAGIKASEFLAKYLKMFDAPPGQGMDFGNQSLDEVEATLVNALADVRALKRELALGDGRPAVMTLEAETVEDKSA